MPQPAKKAQAKGHDAITLLMQDHREVEKLVKEYEKLKEGNARRAKQDVVARACAALKIHTKIEEEIFYPAAREVLDEQDLVDEAKVEHTHIKELVSELEKMEPGDDLYDAKFAVLTEYVKHHVKEEESEMFPKLKKSDLDIGALGEKLSARKAELQ
jgi:hemerythrin superfamily protein